VVGEGKKMDKVYEKLDEAKAEIEKLRAEYKSKAELCENLKKAHNEQLIKSKEASLKSEKQSQDLNEKAEEISVAKQMCEELKCSLNKKESVIRQLSAANDKLRVDCDEKSLKWEKENRDLVLALDQANEKIMDQEQNLRAYREEIEGLKGCLSVSQKKCLGADKRAKASKELRERDDMLLNSEEEKMKLQDQLKWKKEQFAHLQEAHEKLRNQFKASKKDWEQERSTLLDEICSLQTRLDSQTRISEDLKKRLQMCNQALTHEESRRKYLEAQVSEFQKQSENAFAEYQDAKSLLECLTAQRDKEISALRHSLGTKETDYKEMEYQAAKLEQENQELRISLRELQEAGIQESGASSSQAKLRNKLKSLEQMHRDSTVKLRAKEAELNSQIEKMAGDLNGCWSELENKDVAIKELRMELEGYQSLAMQLKLQNEEISVMLLVLKLGISEAQLRLANEKAEMDVQDKEREEKVSLLMKQLEMNNAALSANRAKEADLSSQLEMMAGDLNECRLGLENKDAAIEELRMELEGSQSLAMQLKLQNEEISVMLLVLKLGISEAQLRLANEKAEMDVQDKEREEKVSLLMKQLEMNNAALSANRAKEAGLSSQMEMMAGDLNDCRLGLEDKDTAIEELRMELEGCQSLAMQLKLQNEEISVMLLVLKLGISEAQLRLANEKAEMDVQDKEREEKVSLLMKQLEMNNAALSANRAKEAGLSSQMEMMAGDLNDCRLGLEDKDTAIEELRMGLEGSQSLAMQLKLQNEEISVMLLVLKLGIYEAQLKLASERAEMDVHDKEREEHVSLLMKQLEMKNAALFAKRDKEAELSSQTEKMAGDLKACQFELENKDAAIEELRMELEGCQSLAMQLKLQNEEISVMLLVLKLGISEAQSKLANERIEMDVHDKEREEKVSLLMKQLEMKNSAPSEAQLKLAKEKAELDVYAKEREDNVSLLMKQLEMKNAALLRAQKDTVGEREKAESLDGQRLLMQKELERYKDLLEESSRCQLRLKEQVLQMESSSKEKLGEVCEALERANAEYAEKICENNEIEFELQLWKSIAERLKCDLEENHAVRKELEASLLSQVDVGETIKQEKNSLIQMLEERDRRIDDLQQQIVFLDHKLGARETEAASFAGMETEMSFDPEKVSFFQTTREKDKVLEQFEKEVAWLEQESLRRELESAVLSQTVAERTFAHEKEKLIHQLEDKNQRLHDLMQQVKSLEQEFNSSLVSFSSQLAKKQAEINLVHEAWERLTAAEILTVLEVEEKKLMIVELEDDISNMHQKLELQEQSFCHSRQQALEIEAELDAKQLEIKNLTTQMETKLRTSDALVNELKNEKRSLLEDAMKLLSDRENLLGFITGMGDGISEFSTANSQLMSDLSQMVQSFDNNDSGMVSKEDEELFQSVKENWNIHSSPATKKCEVISDGRPPFRERNN
jgi:chromosome segregation ATPase